MATPEQLSAALIKADAAGDTAAARALAAELRRVSAAQKAPPPEPFANGSTLQVLNPFGKNFDTGIPLSQGVAQGLAGVGKAFVDTGRGVGQMLGMVDRKDVEASRQLDAPLMATSAGKTGNFLGNLALAVPTVMIPGAATVRGAAAIGAVQGLIQPSASTGETVTNVALGGGLGGGSIMAGRAVAGLAGGAKALAEPFSKTGREKIAGRMIQRFAENPASVARATNAPTVTGALPTLAEQTGDRGLAQLQDALRSVDPQIGNQIGQRLADNNAARVGTLQSLAGDSTQRTAAEAARTAASSDLYRQATGAAYTVDGELAGLLSRPAVKQAMARAQQLAANQGRPFTFGVTPAAPFSGLGIRPPSSTQVTGQGLQDLKMAMDEMLTDPASGFTGAAGNTVKNLRGQIMDWMERANPEFKAARGAYAVASKPINAMDIGEHVARKATSNTSDLAGNPRMQANALLGLLRDEPRLIEQATGRKGLGGSLANILDPDQLAKLNAVAAETDRAAAVATAGNGPGSATAQRMASQNILRQLIGPTGLPASWAESAVANTVLGKPFNLVYGGVAEPKIQQALAEAVLDPVAAQRMLQAGVPPVQGPRNQLLELLLQSARTTPSTLATTRER
jgi:hypothetical protein